MASVTLRIDGTEYYARILSIVAVAGDNYLTDDIGSPKYSTIGYLVCARYGSILQQFPLARSISQIIFVVNKEYWLCHLQQRLDMHKPLVNTNRPCNIVRGAKLQPSKAIISVLDLAIERWYDEQCF